MRAAAGGGARNTYVLSRAVPRSLIVISTFTTERSAEPSEGLIEAKGSRPSRSDRSIRTSPPASSVHVRTDSVVVVPGTVVVEAVVGGSTEAVVSGGRVGVDPVDERSSELSVHAAAISAAARSAPPNTTAVLDRTYETSTTRTR